MARIETPREGFTGRGVAGLMFEDGRAETDDPAVIAYARRHGYTVTDDVPPAKEPAGRSRPRTAKEG